MYWRARLSPSAWPMSSPRFMCLGTHLAANTRPLSYCAGDAAELYSGSYRGREYEGSPFVTLHGSWDSLRRSGYKVVRLIFDRNGKPDRRIRGLHDRLRDFRQAGIGVAGRRHRRKGWIAFCHRRRQRDNLAHLVQETNSQLKFSSFPKCLKEDPMSHRPCWKGRKELQLSSTTQQRSH